MGVQRGKVGKNGNARGLVLAVGDLSDPIIGSYFYRGRIACANWVINWILPRAFGLSVHDLQNDWAQMLREICISPIGFFSQYQGYWVSGKMGPERTDQTDTSPYLSFLHRQGEPDRE